VTITLALTGILWRRKRQTKFAETTGVLNRLIRLSIETGALTSGAAICEIILWLAYQTVYYHFIPFLVLGKLYSNVLIATLNCRNPLFLASTASSQNYLSAASSSTAKPQLQSAFWAEPEERGGFKSGVQVSQNTHVDHSSDAIVMTNFNVGSRSQDDIEKGKLA
jgi:hypothetical protein